MHLEKREKILGCLALLSVLVMAGLAITEEDPPSATKMRRSPIRERVVTPQRTADDPVGVERRPMTTLRPAGQDGYDSSSPKLGLLQRRFSRALNELTSDPFAEMANDAATVDAPLTSLVVEGIFEGSRGRSAIVNGQVVREGDVLSGAQAEVWEVRSDSVVLVTCDEHVLPMVGGSTRLTTDGLSGKKLPREGTAEGRKGTHDGPT